MPSEPSDDDYQEGDDDDDDDDDDADSRPLGVASKVATAASKAAASTATASHRMAVVQPIEADHGGDDDGEAEFEEAKPQTTVHAAAAKRKSVISDDED